MGINLSLPSSPRRAASLNSSTNLRRSQRILQRRRNTGSDVMSSDESDSPVNSRETSNEDSDNLSTVLQYLVRRGHIRLVYDVFLDNSDDEDMYEDFTAPQRNKTAIPAADPNPDTSVLDKSDFKQVVLLQSGAASYGEKVPSLLLTLKKREYGLLGSQISGRSPHNLRRSDQCVFGSLFLPNKTVVLEQYPSKAFCGFFSKDGNNFLTACQDCIIRLYNTRQGDFRLRKTVWARDVGWSILDTDMSPDGRFFIYSSWSESIHVCNVSGDTETHDALPLNPTDRRFCIFSLKFSHDGKEILGGANDECLYVYDCEANARVLRIRCHEDDVNTVAFADSSSQILFSAGDDGMCKVWDRRTLHEVHPKAVGVLAGHIDGIVYVDPKGDGRHLITNCKDQTIKLWDMRAFSSSSAVDATRRAVSKQNWDYRWQAVPRKLYSNRKKLEGDTSLMTYRGHCVQQTLIRCHFSPESTTGQRYIYSGCASGRVVLYDVLTGKIAKTLSGHRGCVRDVSWHPYLPQIISTSWDGCVTKWSYLDDSNFAEEEMDTESQVQPRRSKRLADKMRTN